MPVLFNCFFVIINIIMPLFTINASDLKIRSCKSELYVIRSTQIFFLKLAKDAFNKTKK